MQNGPNWCKSSCNEAAPVIFATNAPVPPHWTLNSCFGAFSYNFGAFGKAWLTYETRCKTSRTGTKVRGTNSRRNFSQPMHPIHPHWTLNSCFGAFYTILVHLGPFGWLTKLGAKRPNWYKSSWYEVASKFFETNAPDPSHWTLNSCSGAFRTILVHWGPFGWFTKLGAKRS